MIYLDPMTYEPKPRDHWIDVTQGMSGYFAVEYWVNSEEKDLGPFVEPWNTGLGRYATAKEAYIEARAWAEEQEIPIIQRKDLE